jgi:geranylgeranyl diphosphate synthase, type II
MISAEEARNSVEAAIENLPFDREPDQLYQPIRYILSMGGKRIRPVLTLMSAGLFSGHASDAIYAALAVEVFHNFTLLHDDVMDNAPVRRNMPTVHERWNTNTAILSGDAMLIMAYDLLSRGNPKHLGEVFSVFTQTALEVCEGQQFDMDFEQQDEVSEEEYLRMIELKTAVLLAASLKIGAIIGGAQRGQADQLYEAGRNLGIAFQLQDDMLDAFGDPEVFGKRQGGDILTNKKTYLYIKSLRKTNDKQRNELKRLYASSDLAPEKKISEVMSIFRSCNIEATTTALINQYMDKARRSFDQLDISNENKGVLEALLFSLAGRNK